MSKKINFILISLTTIFILGCAITPTKIHTTPFEVFKATYDDIWTKTLSYLETNKELIVLADKETGDMQTDWTITKWLWSVKRYRYLIKIKSVSTDTTSITVETPYESYAEGTWEPALPTEAKSRALFNTIRPKPQAPVQKPTIQPKEIQPKQPQPTKAPEPKQPAGKIQPIKNFQTR